MDELEVIARQLRRHGMRRSEGVPTVSMLVGDVTVRVEQVELLLRRDGVAFVTTQCKTLPALAAAWVDAVDASHDLVGAALCVSAPEHQDSGTRARAAWHARSPSERALWIEQVIASTRASHVAAAACWLSEYVEEGPALSAEAGDAIGALRRITAWLPTAEWPALCFVGHEATDLEALVALSLTLPALSLVAVVPTEGWSRLRPLLDRRARAVLLEGLISTSMYPPAAADTPPQGTSLPSRTPQSELAADESGLLRTLRDEAAEALSHAQRARAYAQSDAEQACERARSLAELLLYELLMREPVTRGLFELNGVLSFDFGPRPAEVDLVSAELKLAIEVDGYHHFTEATSYRRDRRKDVLLQTQGFWVARYLASDVVEQGEDIVRSVKDLVRRRTET